MNEENHNPLLEKPKPEDAIENFGFEDTIIKTTAGALVSDDNDSPPVDDNPRELFSRDLDESPPIVPRETISGEVEPAKRKPGRPKLTEEEKARRASERAKGPDFSALNGGSPKASVSTDPIQSTSQPKATKPPRDYRLEAEQLFLAVSVPAGQILGPHWGVAWDDVSKRPKYTEEQNQFVMTTANWLEYEKFSPLNPRTVMIIACLGYFGPKFQVEPTKSKVLSWLKKGKDFFSKLIGRK